MSYEDGISATNLDMPPRVPRTEYSVARYHWELINEVTGYEVSHDSVSKKNDVRERLAGKAAKASREFVKRWNFDFMWNTLVDSSYMKGRKTDMGHATYAQGGGDHREAQGSPFDNLDQVYNFDPMQEYGGISRRRMREEFEIDQEENEKIWPTCVNCSGIYVTMFSGLIEAFGWEMLLKALGKNPEKFGEVAQRWEDWISDFFIAYAESNLDLMMVHDDICWKSGPVTHPGWYRKYIIPAYQRLWEPVIDSGTKILFTSDGDYTEFVDDIAGAGAHGFVLEPHTDMKYVAENYGDTHVFIGNADVRALYKGKDSIRKEVQRCMKIGKQYPGFFMAVGNHIPPNVPVENALYYNEIYEELSKR